MIALCVASPEGQVGKTAVCAGIARKLQYDGKRVGYFKPVALKGSDGDCGFMKGVLELADPPEVLCPASVSGADLASWVKLGKQDVLAKVQAAYGAVAKDRDVVCVEALAGIARGSGAAALLRDVLKSVPARLLAVLQYSGETLGHYVEGMDPELKGSLVGVVVNAVPANKMAFKQQVTAGLEVPVFGVLPQDRTLFGLSVAELAQVLGARTLSTGDGMGELVENVMVGASTLDAGPIYYNRKANKAVVVRGERPDMQLAALETSTKCLILTGGVKPIDAVVRQAKRRNVPLLLVEQDTKSAMETISEATRQADFSHEQKARKIDELLGQHFDFKGFCKAVGL